MPWPRIGLALECDFWTCPSCGKPARFWLIYFMDRPRWRCEECGISAWLDSPRNAEDA